MAFVMLFLVAVFSSCWENALSHDIRPPIIIGHRGASGIRPENTLASYEKAIDLGADYIEADVVSTKDHVLVASHNPDITETTDVAEHEEFASRLTVKNVSGEVYKGFFVDDFTVQELQTLRTRERFSFRDHSYDNLYPMPTIQEIIDLVKFKEAELGRKIGMYLETKHPTYYRSVGLPLEELLVETLKINGYSSPNDLVFIESFESNLKQTRLITNLSLIQLVSGTEGDLRQFDTQRFWKDITSERGLAEIATYADGVAPHRSCVFIPGDNNEPVLTSFVEDAHNVGLEVHVWTFRKEKAHFDEKKDKVVLYKTIDEEIRAHFAAGVDGIFTDHTDIGVQIKEEMFPKVNSKFQYYFVIPFVILILSVIVIMKSKKKLYNNKKHSDPSNVNLIQKSPKQSRFKEREERSNSF